MKTECNINNMTAFCGHANKFHMFIADLTSQTANIYEFDIRWLCDYKLDCILKSLDIHTPQPIDTQNFSHRKYQACQSPLSDSCTSLNSNYSILSSTSNLNSSLNSIKGRVSKLYTFFLRYICGYFKFF